MKGFLYKYSFVRSPPTGGNRQCATRNFVNEFLQESNHAQARDYSLVFVRTDCGARRLYKRNIYYYELCRLSRTRTRSAHARAYICNNADEYVFISKTNQKQEIST